LKNVSIKSICSQLSYITALPPVTEMGQIKVAK